MKLGFKKFVSLSLIAVFTIISSSYAFAGYHESNSEPSAQQIVDSSTHIVWLPNDCHHCYYNSAIQCLYLNNNFKTFVVNNNFNEDTQPVLFVLKDLFLKMNEVPSGKELDSEYYERIIGNCGLFRYVENFSKCPYAEEFEKIDTIKALMTEYDFMYLRGKLNKALEKDKFQINLRYYTENSCSGVDYYVNTHEGKFRKLYSDLVSACEKESPDVKNIGLCILDSYSKCENTKHKLIPEDNIEESLEQSYSQFSVVIYTGNHFFVVFKSSDGKYYCLDDCRADEITKDEFYQNVTLNGFYANQNVLLEYIVK